MGKEKSWGEKNQRNNESQRGYQENEAGRRGKHLVEGGGEGRPLGAVKQTNEMLLFIQELEP